jgi:hypothetical protein
VSDYDYPGLKEETSKGRIVWHYTTWDGFVSILRYNELWASDCRFMNDRKEFWHALEFCADLYGPGMEHLHAYIQGLLYSRGHDLPFAHVLSVSGDFDSLEQWRGYASSSVGVALGFDAALLTEILRLQGFIRTKCLYLPKDKTDQVNAQSQTSIETRRNLQAELDSSTDDAARNLFDKNIGWRMQGDYGDFLKHNGLAFKDDKFEREQEIRFISDFEGLSGQVSYHVDHGPVVNPPRAFRLRGSAVLPYAKLSLTLTAEALARIGHKGAVPEHPLRAVMLGPSAEPETLEFQTYGSIPDWIRTLPPDWVTLPAFKVAVSRVPLRI